MSYLRKEYDPDRPKKYWSLQEAKLKIASYCAYQERCQSEVRNKLAENGILGSTAEDLIASMIEEGFLNEERFAQSFVRGKYRLKKWGRNKIQQELKSRQVSPNCIKSGMKEIEEAEYWQNLLIQTEKKWLLTNEKDLFRKRIKVQRYLIGKGFEIELVQLAIEEMISDQNL
jgi:regulatory protein